MPRFSTLRTRWSHAPDGGPSWTVDEGEVTALDVGHLDGRPVAVVGHYGGPTLIDLERGPRRATWPPGPVTAVRWVPGEPEPGGVLIGYEDGTLAVLDPVRGTLGRRASICAGRVTAIALTGPEGDADGIILACLDGTLCGWSTDGGPYRAAAHERAVQSLASGRVDGGDVVVVSGGGDGRIRFWNPDLTERGDPVDTGLAAVQALLVVQHAGRPTVVAGGLTGSIALHDLATGATVSGPHPIHDGGIATLTVVERDGRQVLVCGLASINHLGPRAWDLGTERLLPGVLPRGSGHDQALATAEVGGRTVAVLAHGTGAGRVSVVDADPARFDLAPPGHVGDVLGLAVTSVGGQELVVTSGKDRTLRLTSFDDGRELDRAEPGPHDQPVAVAWTGPDRAQVVVGGVNAPVEIRGAGSGWPVLAASGSIKGRIGRLATVRHGRRDLAVAAAMSGRLHALDLTDPDRIVERALPEFGEDWLMGFDLAGSGLLAVSRGRHVRLLDTADGRVAGQWEELGRVFALAQVRVDRRDRDGHDELVAVATDEQIIRLRDRAGAETRRALVGHTDMITDLAAVDGTGLLLSAAEDGTLRLWDADRSAELAVTRLGWRVERLVPRLLDGRLAVAVAGEHLAVVDVELPQR